jgi:hypothetical protein
MAVSGRVLMTQPTFGNSTKLSFWEPSTAAHSIGLEGWWNVWRSHQNEGWKFRDEVGRNKLEINGGLGLGGTSMIVHPADPNGTSEGAEITMKGAGTHLPWGMDVINDAFRIYKVADSGVHTVNIEAYGNGVAELRVEGQLIGAGKQFLIDHPKDPANQNLRHISIEAPRGDLIYRGRVRLKNGRARVNLDDASNMSTGTFDALTRDAQVFLQNDSGWSALKGRVRNGVLVISCEDSASIDEVSWMVVAERADRAYLHGGLLDENAEFITEIAKPELSASALEPRYGPVDGVEDVLEASGTRGYYLRPEFFAPDAEMPKRQVRARVKEYRGQRD